LAYISCKNGFHCDVFIYVYNIPWPNPPPYLPCSLLGTNLPYFVAVFSYMCIEYFNHIHLQALPLNHLPSDCIHTPKQLVLHCSHSFLGLDSACKSFSFFFFLLCYSDWLIFYWPLPSKSLILESVRPSVTTPVLKNKNKNLILLFI
jgi:hypothetical protein